MNTIQPILKRTEVKNLTSVRLLLVVVIGIVAVLLYLNKNGYALFFSCVVIPLLFISVTEIKLFSHSLEIKKYYLCGIFPVKYKLYRGKKIRIKVIDASMPDIDPEVVTPNFEAERYLIKYLDNNGKAISVTCNLKENEYKLTKEVLGI